MNTTGGKRVEPVDGQLWLKEGEYGKDPRDGQWYCRVPGGHLGGLEKHKVIEYEDGTITVSPSILINTTDKEGKRMQLWHGYLERGIWREC